MNAQDETEIGQLYDLIHRIVQTSRQTFVRYF